MGKDSSIEWCHHTFNPWLGCAHVSPGCANCYAEDASKRYGQEIWGAKASRRFLSESYWREPLKWNAEAERAGERRRVFCASFADVFEPREDLVFARARLWALIAETPWLDWLLLTKRPEEVLGMVPWEEDAWPPNVWVGTSVENQEWADRRIPILLEIPAAVRFLSVEPLLGEVDLSAYLVPYSYRDELEFELRIEGHDPYEAEGIAGATEDRPDLRPVDWVIVGGESGPKARPMHPAWERSVRDACAAAGVPYLFKQWGCYRSFVTPFDGNRGEPDLYMAEDGRTATEPEALADGGDWVGLWRFSKKQAGRTDIDGAVYDEYPAPAVSAMDLGRLL